jgi:hypothetical protein
MQQSPQSCPICGSVAFGPGPKGRLSTTGLPPWCSGCGSLERHRIIRLIFDALEDSMVAGCSALNFAGDPAAPRERFARFEVSLYQRDNSLDIMDIDRPDGSYDWVLANHVLEHVSDDLAAVREMLRVAGRSGVVQVTVPTPKTQLETVVLDAPDPDSYDHYRGYGSDFPQRIAPALGDAAAIQTVGFDPATRSWDVVYLFSRDHDRLLKLGGMLLAAGLPTLKAA